MKKDFHSVSGYIKSNGGDLSYDRNNCAPKALVALTGIDYNRVNKELGRKPGKGTAISCSRAFITKHGFTKLPESALKNTYINGGVPVQRKMTVGSFAKAHPSGKYMVYVRLHAVAIIDGKVLDDWNSTSRRVTEAWETK